MNTYTIEASLFDKPQSLITHTAEETEAFGAAFADFLLKNHAYPRYVALRGDLGVGKTVFVRGFTSVIAPGLPVRSPTFALVNEYRNKDNRRLPPIFHFDMYRITGEDDLYSIGYDDYLDAGICLVEWSENIPYALPCRYFRVTIEKTDVTVPEERRITWELL